MAAIYTITVTSNEDDLTPEMKEPMEAEGFVLLLLSGEKRKAVIHQTSVGDIAEALAGCAPLKRAAQLTTLNALFSKEKGDSVAGDSAQGENGAAGDSDTNSDTDAVADTDAAGDSAQEEDDVIGDSAQGEDDAVGDSAATGASVISAQSTPVHA